MNIELLNLDWLTINYLVENSPLKQGLEYHSNLVKFIPENYGTRQFRNVYKVYFKYEESEIATIVCNPLAKILDPRIVQIKLSNWVLYTPYARDWLHRIKKELSAKFLSISRIDLCVDIQNFDFYGFIKKYHDDELREKKPKQVSEHYKKYDNGSIYTGISWGSKTSDWTAKIYDKIREIHEESGKLYILDYFKANGIDVEKDKVWRYEFSITNVRGRYYLEDEYTIDDITLDDDNIFQWGLQKYVLQYYLNLHAFCYNTGKVRFIDEKRYNIVNLLFQEIPPTKINKKREKRRDYSAKITINLGMQMLEYQTTCDAFITYKNILETAREYNLTQWLIEKHGKRLREIYIQNSFIVYGVGVEYKVQEDLFTEKIYLKSRQ